MAGVSVSDNRRLDYGKWIFSLPEKHVFSAIGSFPIKGNGQMYQIRPLQA
jgi:hypothetical protein